MPSKQYKPPFPVERLTLQQVQHNADSRKAIRSLSADQLNALAQHARLLATVVRDDKMAEGCLLFFNELVKVHNKAKRERLAQQKKDIAEAKKKEKEKPQTWKESLVSGPRR